MKRREGMPRSDWYSDTDPRALEVFLECHRKMSASQKVNTILELSEMVFEMAKAEIRRHNPGIGEREVLLRAAARHLDRDTMIRAYGWDPEGSRG
ncbi:MAG: hypothetical protein ACLP59_17610 [Bryobacteraceae bacterium]